jgi:hypothetical protein
MSSNAEPRILASGDGWRVVEDTIGLLAQVGQDGAWVAVAERSLSGRIWLINDSTEYPFSVTDLPRIAAALTALAELAQGRSP